MAGRNLAMRGPIGVPPVVLNRYPGACLRHTALATAVAPRWLNFVYYSAIHVKSLAEIGKVERWSNAHARTFLDDLTVRWLEAAL